MRSKKILISILVLVSLIGVLSLANVKPQQGLSCQIVSIGNTNVRAEVADTPDSRTQGLSGRIAFPAGTGMLFVFERPGLYSFWMKEMNFPIDIIWVNKDKKVVGAVERAHPESFPRIFMSSESILYALEVPAGFIDSNQIKIGEVITFAEC